MTSPTLGSSQDTCTIITAKILVLCAHIFVSDIYAWTPQQSNLSRHRHLTTFPMRRLCGHCNMNGDRYTICCLRRVHVVPERHAGMGSVLPASLQDYVHGDACARRGLCRGFRGPPHSAMHHMVMVMIFGQYQAFAQSCGVLRASIFHTIPVTVLFSSGWEEQLYLSKGLWL